MARTMELGALIASLFDDALEVARDSETTSCLAAMATLRTLAIQHPELAARLMVSSATVLGYELETD
jgi:hypothetical protein